MRRMTILYHQVGPSLVRRPLDQTGLREPSEQDVVTEDHWDWLFETRDNSSSDLRLATWATDPIEPHALRPPFSLQRSATQLAPHRKVYLDFEGEIGQKRGRVRQIATGHLQVLRETNAMLECELQMKRSSHFRVNQPLQLILALKEDAWTLQLSSL